jgi:hypothetical protein
MEIVVKFKRATKTFLTKSKVAFNSSKRLVHAVFAPGRASRKAMNISAVQGYCIAVLTGHGRKVLFTLYSKNVTLIIIPGEI